MANKPHIRKSVYNQGKLEAEHILPNEMFLDGLSKDKDRLTRTIALLQNFKKFEAGPFDISRRCSITANDFLSVNEDWTPSSPLNFAQVFEKTFWHSDFDDIINLNLPSFQRNNAKLNPHDRIATINDELRSLKLELKKKFSLRLIHQIRILVQELHSIISFYFSEQRKYVKQLRINLCGSVIRDIRKIYRQTIQIIFKNLPDFSGCEEEEAKFTPIVNFKPLFLLNNQKNNVRHKIFTRLTGFCY